MTTPLRSLFALAGSLLFTTPLAAQTIVPLVTGLPDKAHACLERHLCVDTTAAVCTRASQPRIAARTLSSSTISPTVKCAISVFR